jgi:hypothetical protein
MTNRDTTIKKEDLNNFGNFFRAHYARRNMFFEKRLLRLAHNDAFLQVLIWVGRG